ncbi:MAG: hypothetical protein EOO75_13310 [Myxococcales bacterium]|nr:MAG: hypothetical protein EOO75_13310 [Myxococcales bacterium]
MATAKPKPKPSRSGPNIPEEQRGETGRQKKLRWSDDQIAALARLATRWGVSESAAAARAVEEALARK